MKKRKVLIVLITIIVSLLSTGFLGAYFLFLHHYKGKPYSYIWSESDEFKIENIATVEKKPDKDFVILNLADVQMSDLGDFFNRHTIHKELNYLVEKTKPDLITLTGDQTWSNENLISLKSLIKWLDGYKIPYAPVFGNHDYGNDFDSAVAGVNYCCDLYENGKYSLFKRGPSNLGSLGNYVVNITENGKILKSLYMMDSGYTDIISDQQISWFNWNAEGIKNANDGEYAEAMVFIHKPLPEFRTAYLRYYYGYDDVEAIGDVNVHFSLSGSIQNGFFDIAKSKGVKDVVCGHQHGNNFTLKYQDVRLTFAMKTTETMSYYDDGKVYLNGATFFKIGNETKVENITVDRNKFHLKNSNNVFYD